MSDNLSTSATLTHREYVDKWLALAVATTTFVGYVTSVYWERLWGPRLLLRHEIHLENEIIRLESEADAVCTTSQLYEHSQLMRRAALLRRELLQERRKRYCYQLSVDSMFSPLSTAHSVRRNFSMQDATEPPVPRPLPVAKSAPTSVAQSPISRQESMRVRESRTPPKLVPRLIRQSVWDPVWYNLLALIKYLLRFGHMLVYLYLFGQRPGMIVMPPSLEESARLYLSNVVIPCGFNVALYGPAILFAPRQVTKEDLAEHPHKMETNVMPFESDSNGIFFATPEQLKNITHPLHLIRRYDESRICASNGLLCWFACCFLAAYLVMRVFAP